MTDNTHKASFILQKRGLYYRPKNNGYTGIKTEAGRYDECDAIPECGVFAIHEDKAPLFAPACWHDLQVKFLLEEIGKRDREIAQLKAQL